MFDTPNWLGSFITSRSNKEINDLNRKHEVIMEDIKHKHNYLIQSEKNQVTENVAGMNRQSAEDIARENRISNEEIARLNREHEAEIAKARNQNAISVALIQAAANTTKTALPYIIPAFAAGKLSNGKSNNNTGSNSNSKPNVPVVTITATEAKQASNRKKADDLFPQLEPTFGVSLTNGNALPKINITQLVPAVGAVLSVAAPILAIL